jgi:hypothetical protein
MVRNLLGWHRPLGPSPGMPGKRNAAGYPNRLDLHRPVLCGPSDGHPLLPAPSSEQVAVFAANPNSTRPLLTLAKTRALPFSTRAHGAASFSTRTATRILNATRIPERTPDEE